MALEQEGLLEKKLTRRELLGWGAATAVSGLAAASAVATLGAEILNHACPPTQTSLECRRELDYEIAPPLTAGIFLSLLTAWFAGHWVPDTFPRHIQPAQPNQPESLSDPNP